MAGMIPPADIDTLKAWMPPHTFIWTEAMACVWTGVMVIQAIIRSLICGDGHPRQKPEPLERNWPPIR